MAESEVERLERELCSTVGPMSFDARLEFAAALARLRSACIAQGRAEALDALGISADELLGRERGR